MGLLALTAVIWSYKPYLITSFFQKNEDIRTLYKEARELQLNGDFRSAYYTYGKISRRYKLYDVVLYQQAKCAAAVEDEKTAIEKYSAILNSSPESPLAPIVSYNLGQAYMRLKNHIEAEKQFLNTIKNFSGTEYALGSFYYLGVLNKNKDPDQAIKYWSKYIALAPAGRFALESYEGLKSLGFDFPELSDKNHAGIALFMNKKYNQALKFFNQLPLSESWYYRGLCHRALGNKGQAASMFREGLINYLDDSMNRARIENLMSFYVEVNNETKFKSWSDILRWTDRARDFALYHHAQLLSLKKARKNYEEIYNDYRLGNYASEALWNLFWYEYDKGSYNKALELGKEHIIKFENKNASPAVNFWMGKIFENKNNKREAQKFYKKVIDFFPDSYYAFRATGRINALNGKQDNGWKTSIENRLPGELQEKEFPYSYDEIAEKHSIQAAELFYLGDYDTAMLFVSKDPFLESWVMFQKSEQLERSIILARNEMRDLLNRPNNNHPVWKLIYPIYHVEDINKNSRYNSLDPYIVISVMKEESHFNPFAVSSANARGLMQVLPITAQDITRWRKMGRYTTHQLFDPETNIMIGAAYLGYTSEVFNGNMLFAVAAYNAGPTAVQTWQKKLSLDDLDKFVENIPYNQTRDYVKKVFGSYWNYKRIYLSRVID